MVRLVCGDGGTAKKKARQTNHRSLGKGEDDESHRRSSGHRVANGSRDTSDGEFLGAANKLYVHHFSSYVEARV